MPDAVIVAPRRRARQGETYTLGLTQRMRLFEGLFGLKAKGFDGCTERQELLCGWTHQRHHDMPVAATAAAQATHPLGEGGPQVGDLAWCGPAAALLGHVVDERARCLGALYRVVAAVTRWLPWALGKVSLTRGAGLTSPSSRAAAD